MGEKSTVALYPSSIDKRFFILERKRRRRVQLLLRTAHRFSQLGINLD